MTTDQLVAAATYNHKRWAAGRIYPLAMLGYLQLTVGKVDAGSVAEALCVADWQKARGLQVDGKMGPTTCDAIHTAALRGQGIDPAVQLTANFGRDEFDCNDGTPVPDRYLAAVRETARCLEVIRAEACGGRSITIVSGWRSEEHNRKSGGADRSEHLTGRAADWRCLELQALVELAQIRADVDRLMRAGRIPMGGSQHYPRKKHRWHHFDHRGGTAPQHWDKAAGAV